MLLDKVVHGDPPEGGPQIDHFPLVVHLPLATHGVGTRPYQLLRKVHHREVVPVRLLQQSSFHVLL